MSFRKLSELGKSGNGSSKPLQAFCITLAVALASPALAQVAPGGSQLTRPVFYEAPPAGFDPAFATDAELAQFGIPPRPDQSQPALYNHWLKMVTAPQTRLTNVTVQTTNFINGVVKNRKDNGGIENTISTTSDNWSGYAIYSPNGTFKANDSFVYGEWVVPAAGVQSTCQYGEYASSQWVGFDGFGSGDVLQAGTAITACGTSYVAWYEWYTGSCTVNSTVYPCYQNNFSLPVNPGDTISTEVWYTTAAPQGHAYMINYNAGKSVSVAFYQPPATGNANRYVGNGAEWIVERPGFVGGGLADLENYVAVPMNFAYAYDGSAYFYPASVPAGSTIYDIAMTCPPWNPSSSCPSTTDISFADLYGTFTLWFYDEGPAWVY